MGKVLVFHCECKRFGRKYKTHAVPPKTETESSTVSDVEGTRQRSLAFVEAVIIGHSFSCPLQLVPRLVVPPQFYPLSSVIWVCDSNAMELQLRHEGMSVLCIDIIFVQLFTLWILWSRFLRVHVINRRTMNDSHPCDPDIAEPD